MVLTLLAAGQDDHQGSPQPESSRFTGVPRPAAVLLPAACFTPVESTIPMVMTTMFIPGGLGHLFQDGR